MSTDIINQYFSEFSENLQPRWFPRRADQLVTQILRVKSSGGKLLLAGNGASASIASHFALDFTKQGSVRAQSFNDAALLTAYGNDYGYENWIAKALEHYGDCGDLAILISSSGRSPNVVQGAQMAKERGLTVATFSGFEKDNPLDSAGDIRFWLNSTTYNIVESIHATWLGAICDLLSARTCLEE